MQGLASLEGRRMVWIIQYREEGHCRSNLATTMRRQHQSRQWAGKGCFPAE